MSGYFRRLAARAQGEAPMLAPRPASRYEEAAEMPAWDEASSPAGPTPGRAAAPPPQGGPAREGRPEVSAPIGDASRPPAAIRAMQAMAARATPAPAHAARREMTGMRAQQAATQAADAIGQGPSASAPAAPAGRAAGAAWADASRAAVLAEHTPRGAAPTSPGGEAAASPEAEDGALPAWPALPERRFGAAGPLAVQQPAPAPGTVVQDAAAATEISIGRVEIRFAPPPGAPAVPRAAGPPPLAEFLGATRRSRPS